MPSHPYLSFLLSIYSIPSIFMEISLSLKPLSVPKTAPKSRFPIKNLKINKIFCSRVQELSMQRESNSTNLYKVLSLESEDVGFVEIKKAYRRLALQFHPDLCPSSKKEESTKKFVELQKAYETLSDPDSRARYDTLLSLGGDSNIDSAVGMRGQRNQTRSKFSKMVWEDQLFELQKRSANRMEKKKHSCM